MKRFILIATFVLMAIALMTSFAFADTGYSLQAEAEGGSWGNYFEITKGESLALTLWKCEDTESEPLKIETIKCNKKDFVVVNGEGKTLKSSVFTLKEKSGKLSIEYKGGCGQWEEVYLYYTGEDFNFGDGRECIVLLTNNIKDYSKYETVLWASSEPVKENVYSELLWNNIEFNNAGQNVYYLYYHVDGYDDSQEAYYAEGDFDTFEIIDEKGKKAGKNFKLEKEGEAVKITCVNKKCSGMFVLRQNDGDSFIGPVVMMVNKEDAIKDVKASTVKCTLKTSGGKVTVNVKQTKGEFDVDGYQIQKSTKKSTGYSLVKETSKKNYKDSKGLKKGKTYYYKIRTYKVIDGVTYYGKWSKAVSVKVK